MKIEFYFERGQGFGLDRYSERGKSSFVGKTLRLWWLSVAVGYARTASWSGL